jgi:hypothetical protein
MLVAQFTQQLECCNTKFSDLHHLICHLESCHADDHINVAPHFHDAPLKRIDSPSDAIHYPPSAPKITVNLADVCRPYESQDSESEQDSLSDASDDSLFAARPLTVPVLPDISLKRRRFKTRKQNKKLKRPSEPRNESDTQEEVIDTDDTQCEIQEKEKLVTPPSTPNPSTPLPTSAQQKKQKHAHLSVICPLTGERKFICAVPTCRKQYKNANGLKYHLQHAHSDGVGVPEEYAELQKRRDGEEYRPYQCTIVNCYKRYKNLNGLKYPIDHAHKSLLPPSTDDATPLNQQKKQPMQQPWMHPHHSLNPAYMPLYGFPTSLAPTPTKKI